MPNVTVTFNSDEGTIIDLSITSEKMESLHFPNAVAATLDMAIRTTEKGGEPPHRLHLGEWERKQS